MKRKMTRAFWSVIGSVLLAAAASAQEVPKSINGGVLNGKAVSLPKPVYPASAKAAGVSGAVKVQIIIDEAGLVESARAVADDEECDKGETPGVSDRCRALASLRDAAERVATQAQFSPTRLSGNPVKVKGVIVYNFVSGTTIDERPAEVDGPILNGRAIELPNAQYPNAAKALGVSGRVTVLVVIDEFGNVISASATSGHPLLRAAAVTAAKAARFAPTELEGQPVKVTGVLTYNFVRPPAN